jgi:hypothetical protein
MTDTERIILAAAENFVRAMRLPADHGTRIADWQEEQVAALAALVDAVNLKDAIDATDS